MIAASGDDVPATWSEHVAPILYENCVACHRPGEAGPFSLLRYEDATKVASLIARVTRSGFMPPWLAEPGEVPFVGERRLDEHEIRTLERWAAEGAPEGDPELAPEPPQFSSGWQLGEPDLVVESPEAWVLPAEGADVFRTFVLPDVVDRNRHVRGIELRIADKRVVHHVEVRVDASDESWKRDLEEPGPGHEGMSDDGNARLPDGYYVGWTPGQTPFLLEDGWSWPLDAGSDLVLLFHMLPSGKVEEIRPKVGLLFSDDPPARRPFVLRVGAETHDIAAGASDYVIEASYRLPVDVEIMSLHPHAHYLGKRLYAEALAPDGERQVLIEIPEWDFNWQEEYRFARPVALAAGTALRMQYSYDDSENNPRNPHRPPQRVRYGPGSLDEMGDLWVQVLPKRPEDRATLARDFAKHDLRVVAGRYRARVEAAPDDAEGHDRLGLALARLGDHTSALEHYKRALAIDPNSARVHHNLGSLYAQQREWRAARRHLGTAIAIDPEHALSHKNLGNVLLMMGKEAEAERHYRLSYALAPMDLDLPTNLGALALRGGRAAEALGHYEAALQLDPDSESLRASAARARAMMDR